MQYQVQSPQQRCWIGLWPSIDLMCTMPLRNESIDRIVGADPPSTIPCGIPDDELSLWYSRTTYGLECPMTFCCNCIGVRCNFFIPLNSLVNPGSQYPDFFVTQRLTSILRWHLEISFQARDDMYQKALFTFTGDNQRNSIRLANHLGIVI